MGRPRKDEKQKETAELMISVEDFARTRDSVSRALFCNARRLPMRAVPTPHHHPQSTKPRARRAIEDGFPDACSSVMF